MKRPLTMILLLVALLGLASGAAADQQACSFLLDNCYYVADLEYQVCIVLVTPEEQFECLLTKWAKETACDAEYDDCIGSWCPLISI